MKVITWFHSNSELIARVLKEDESDEDMDQNEEEVINVIVFCIINLNK